jgi:glycosyltransferase involved in cell wall biosynthesis
LEYGGEEYVAGRIEDALADRHEMFRYIGSSKELLRGSLYEQFMIPWRTLYNKKTEKDLIREQIRNKHDLWVVHNVFPALSPSVFEVARKCGIPIIYYLHNYRMSCANGYFYNHRKTCERCIQGNFWPAFLTGCWRNSRMISGWMGIILQRMRNDGVFRQVRRWVTPSESLKNVHLRMGLPSNRIDVIPHYYLTDLTCPVANPNGAILFLGRLSEEKGVDLLLRAWSLVKNKDRPLWIAGIGPDLKRLQAFAQKLNLTKVEWLGFVPRQKQSQLWAKTAFSIMPSIWKEPYGLSFLEAWKNGRPFIGNRTGALEEVLKDGRGGLLCEKNSAESLARKIESYINKPELIIRAGAEGHAKVLERNNKELWMQSFNITLEKTLDPTYYQRSLPREGSEIFNACTLFDTGFLAKGLALFASLKRQKRPFRLHVFAMDDFCADYLGKMRDPDLVVIRKNDFEDSELLHVKGQRTRAEYYWTCTSSVLLYSLTKLGLTCCTYLDADLYFYDAAQKLEARMGDASIGITPHSYAAEYDQSRAHGVYCVQYVTIRNNEKGLSVLQWWRRQCLDWCFARVEPGKFGDQKYLDDWPERFQGVKVLDGPGVGLAPWNCKNYSINPEAERRWTVRDISDNTEGPLIFFHFHEMRFFTKNRIKRVAGGYNINENVLKNIYQPYIKELLEIAKEIAREYPQANPLAIAAPQQFKKIAAQTYSLLNHNFKNHYMPISKAIAE